MLHLYSPLQVNIGELERPDQKPYPIKGLPGIMARAIGRDMEEIYKGNNKVRQGGGESEGAKYTCTATFHNSLSGFLPPSLPPILLPLSAGTLFPFPSPPGYPG